MHTRLTDHHTHNQNPSPLYSHTLFYLPTTRNKNNSSLGSLHLLLDEQEIVAHEARSAMYRTSAYFCAKQVNGWVNWLVGVVRCTRRPSTATAIHPSIHLLTNTTPPQPPHTHTQKNQVAELPIQLSTTALFAVVIYWMVGFQRHAGRFLNYLAAMVLTSLVGESYIRAYVCLSINDAYACLPACLCLSFSSSCGGLCMSPSSLT